MAKTSEDLEKGRIGKAHVLSQFGSVPTSVWEIDYSWGKSTLELDNRKQTEVAEKKHHKMKYNLKTFETLAGEKKEVNQILDAFDMSSLNVRGKGSGVSTFPPDLCRKITNFYSEEGETVLDCCAGHASRLETVHKLNRHYIGYEICKEYMKFNRRVVDKLTTNQLFPSKYSVTLREQSSEKMEELNNSIDLIFTSPPYWCFHPKTEVITNRGLLPIKDLKEGDLVYTHKARYNPIIGVSSRKIKGSIFQINTWGNQLPIKLTKNHKLYAVKKTNCPYFLKTVQACKPECAYLRCGDNIKHKCKKAFKKYSPGWIKAAKLIKGDFLIYPIDKRIKNIKSIKISDYVPNLKIKKNRIILNNNQYGNSSMLNIIPINDAFIRLCGYYLAEGHCGDNCEITFTFNKKELPFINEVRHTFKHLWNVKCKTYTYDNVIHLKFYKTPICSLFKNIFGKISHELHIPEFLMLLPYKKQMLLVETFFYGDGCKVHNSGYNFCSTSGILIEQIKQILLRNNIVPCISKIERTNDTRFLGRQLITMRHNVYHLSLTAKTELAKFKSFIDHKRLRRKDKKAQIGSPYGFILKDNLYLPIRKIITIPYNGKVYNCEVKQDSSFTLSNCSSHNCIEYYDNDPRQIGYNKTYEEFLAGLKRILAECYRVLKPGKICAFNVNDFRKDGKFYMFHADTARLMQEVGFKLHDIIIIVWGNCMGSAFANQVWERKVSAKRHEYLVIGKKV